MILKKFQARKILAIFLVNLIFTINPIMADSKYDTSHLTPLQKEVAIHGGTERAFDNEYWDHEAEGIYVDIISGQALFSSTDKFDSGTGWPSFTKPIAQDIINERKDNSLGMSRVEVKSSKSDAHLGHVFNDGPVEDGGMRYCINSASLRFIAKDQLEKEGYGQYLKLFAKENNNYDKAVLAGGCFWGMEDLFAKLDGVINVVNGYSGGSIKNPTYELVTTGITGHAESIEITFDPNKISYEEILRFFLQIHDPTQLNRQQNDIGTQYRSAIFYNNIEQKELARKLIAKANQSGVFDGPIVTQITKFDNFWPAEKYHQDYLIKNPNGYSCHSIRKEWVF